MTAVVDVNPTLVSREGVVVSVEFANETDAKSFVQAFASAKLFREDPAEYARRYDAQHGVDRYSAASPATQE